VWGYPIPEDEFYAVWLALLENSEEIERMLKSPRITSLRLVMNPEKMVIDESRRAFLYFNLLGMNTDAIVLNKIYPPEVSGDYYREWKKEHKAYVKAIEEGFGETPVFKAELQRDQVVGIDRLRDLCKELFGEKDPAATFLVGKPIRFFQQGHRYRMSVKMPFAQSEDIKVLRKNGSLLIRVGKYERNFQLPWVLLDLDVERASLIDGALEITFKAARHSA